MRTLSVTGAVLALLLAGCGTDAPADAGPTGTVGALRDLTGDVSINEPDLVPVAEQSARSDVVVTGPVTDVTDAGPLDPAGSITHRFVLTVRVVDDLKGSPGATVQVSVLGDGDASALRRRLGGERGLWMLTRVGEALVPVQSTGVVFDQRGRAVAPFAEADERPSAATLDEAVAQARAGKDAAPRR